MNNLITIKDSEAYLENETSNILIDLDRKIKDLTDLRDTIRNQIKNEMEDKGIKKAISQDGKYMATFTPEDKFVQTFDKTTFRKENPDMFDKYIIFTTRASFVSFRSRKQ